MLEAVRFLDPLELMLKLLKLAKPAESVVLVLVPLRVPVPLLKVITTDTPGTLLVKLSATWTVTADEIVTPAVASVGCCVKIN